MGTITITYPDAYKADMVAVLRDSLGPDAAGLTDAAAVQKALLQYVRGLVLARRRVTSPAVAAAVSAASAALSDREVSLYNAQKARKDAEIAEDAAVRTAFGDA